MMDKGEKSAENDEKGVELGVKNKDDPQEETIKVGASVFFCSIMSIG